MSHALMSEIIDGYLYDVYKQENGNYEVSKFELLPKCENDQWLDRWESISSILDIEAESPREALKDWLQLL